MVILAVLLVVLVAMFAMGYRRVAAGANPQVASGVLTIAVTVGLTVWLLDNITW